MNPNRPQFLASPLLDDAGFPHAFFTRLGGVSGGPFTSLNFSFTVGDEPEAVRMNLQRAAETLGVTPDRLYYLSQVHGRTVVTLDGSEPAGDVRAIEGDAVVSRPGNHAVAVRVADCVPVLLGDPTTRVVAAVHAGWRGVVANVVQAAVVAMEGAGASAAGLLAAIGPHLSVDAFEVGEEVAGELAQAAGTDDVVARASGRKPHVSLLRVVAHQLVAAGLHPDRVDFVGGCTHSDPTRFFSYRRDGARSGRHLAAIVGRH
jgi:YfiH family protein